MVASDHFPVPENFWLGLAIESTGTPWNHFSEYLPGEKCLAQPQPDRLLASSFRKRLGTRRHLLVDNLVGVRSEPELPAPKLGCEICSPAKSLTVSGLINGKPKH